MKQEEKDYFLMRAEGELERAQAAGHPRAVRAHYHLANLYLDHVFGEAGREPGPEGELRFGDVAGS